MRAKPGPVDDAGRLRLTAFLPGQPGRLFHLEPDRRYVLGRSADADVCLDDPSVSRIHLALEPGETGWLAVDQVSKNGTRLDGRAVDRAVMPARGWLELGGVPLLFQVDAAAADGLGRSVDSGTAERAAGSSRSDSLDQAVTELARISGCERAGLWLVGEEGETRILMQLDDFDPPPSMTAIARAAASGNSEFCSDTEGARALEGSESIAKGGIRAFFAMPVVRGERVLAVAYADSLAPGRIFTQHDAGLLDAGIRQLALILESARVRDTIRSLRQGL